MEPSRLRAARDGALCLGLVAALWAPLLEAVLQVEPPFELNELRELAARPAPPKGFGSLTAWPRAFEAWFNDHFGFRRTLLRLHARAMVGLFRVAGGTRDVAVGTDGWLYYTGAGALRDYAAVQPFTEAQRARCREVLAARASWLAERHAAYLVTVAPDKHTIYPEHLPAWVRRVGRRTRLDQFLACVEGVPNLAVVDLRPALLAAKHETRLYQVTGTHWNDAGAFVAARELARALARRFPAVTPPEARALEASTVVTAGADLARMLGLADVLTEEYTWLRLGAARASAVTTDVLPSVPQRVRARQPFATTTARAAGLPAAVVFRDSFFEALAPFLAPCLRRGVWYSQREFDRRVVERERPDVVIEEVVERNLETLFGGGPFAEPAPPTPR